MLAALHTQLVERDFTRANVFFDSVFLAHWKDAARYHAFSRGTYEEFVRQAAIGWNVSADFVRVHAEVLWAVLTGYPARRAAARVRSPIPRAMRPSDFEIGGTIVLRGFRRAH